MCTGAWHGRFSCCTLNLETEAFFFFDSFFRSLRKWLSEHFHLSAAQKYCNNDDIKCNLLRHRIPPSLSLSFFPWPPPAFIRPPFV